MARVTGLEPAASCVTGMRSNQLSYTRQFLRWYLMAVFMTKVNKEFSFIKTSEITLILLF